MEATVVKASSNTIFPLIYPRAVINFKIGNDPGNDQGKAIFKALGIVNFNTVTY